MTAYLDRDEELPAATRSLVWVGRSFRRCPECGAWFFRDYWPPGAGNVGDFETLQRLAGTLLDAVAALLAEGGPEGAGDATARVLAAGASEQDGDILEEAWIWRLSQPGGGIPGFAGLLRHPRPEVVRFGERLRREAERKHLDLSGSSPEPSPAILPPQPTVPVEPVIRETPPRKRSAARTSRTGGHRPRKGA